MCLINRESVWLRLEIFSNYTQSKHKRKKKDWAMQTKIEETNGFVGQ